MHRDNSLENFMSCTCAQWLQAKRKMLDAQSFTAVDFNVRI